VLDLSKYDVIDWDDPEVDPDPETNNLLHCQRADHLRPQAEMVVYECLYSGPWAQVKFRVQTAQYPIVGLALSRLWLLLLKDSHKRPDWLRPVSGWRAESAEIREWERAIGARWRGEEMTADRPRELIEGSGRRGETRRLDQMVSARLDPPLVAALKHFAEKHGMSFSEVLREAALLLLAREEAQNVISYSLKITNETRPDGIRQAEDRGDIPAAV
jgi:hypothetical protein